jgi:hypothetical protein
MSMYHIESPRTDDAGVEQQIQAKGKTAARVTPADIEANIIDELFFTAREASIGLDVALDERPVVATQAHRLLTFCVLTLRNGFTVTGESACASPENFDAEIGRRIARENAKQKIWPLMGYELRSKLAAQPTDHRDRVRAEKAELDEKLAKLDTFGRTELFASLPADEQGRMNRQHSLMQQYSAVLGERIAASPA